MLHKSFIFLKPTNIIQSFSRRQSMASSLSWSQHPRVSQWGKLLAVKPPKILAVKHENCQILTISNKKQVNRKKFLVTAMEIF